MFVVFTGEKGSFLGCFLSAAFLTLIGFYIHFSKPVSLPVSVAKHKTICSCRVKKKHISYAV